jgi:hypothetical protein
MPFRQYTSCYLHGPGDKPFNENDLVGYVLGVSAPGLIVAILAFLGGSSPIGFIAIAIQYAVSITAVANQWLFHRLVCVSGDKCAIGVVETNAEMGSLLGEFDNDQYFDLRLMPHRHKDEYRSQNTGFFAPPANPSDPFGTPPWTTNTPPRPGPSDDGRTELTPLNDIFLDSLQGSAFLRPTITDLPYTQVDTKDVPLNDATVMTKVARCTLHCEAEGNFWAAMKDYAVLLGTFVGVGSAAGAAAGAAAGCAIGGIFGPIGCFIGGIVGAIAGALAGGAGAAYLGASAAFNADPGDLNDANVGDLPLSPLSPGDQVAVFGTHVYDGFHTGWHEFHPLKTIIKASDPKFIHGLPYLEWSPDPPSAPIPYGLSAADMQAGLQSPAFTKAAANLWNQWCGLLTEANDPNVRNTQNKPDNRWTVHPGVDGCNPDEGGGVEVPR